jgi:ribose transport system permease protein
MKRSSSFAQFVGPLVALMLIATVVAVTTPSFLAADNFRNIALQVAVLSIVALGATVVILTGGIDLSPGSMIAYLTMVLAVMVKVQGQSLWLAIPAAIALGGLLGLVNGVLVAYVRIPAFIVTLAGLSAFKGIALTVGGGTPIFSLSPDLGQVFYGELLGIPLPFYYVVGLYGLATLVLNHSKFGREIHAVGGNESAARLSGIHVSRVRLLAFVIAGACAGIGAVLLAARLNSGSPNYGTLIELQAIAAAVVGGASLAGGRGHVLNTLVGVLIIVVVQNGLNLNAVSTSVQGITIGLIILLAVGVDIWRERLTAVFVERFGKRHPLARQEAAS